MATGAKPFIANLTSLVKAVEEDIENRKEGFFGNLRKNISDFFDSVWKIVTGIVIIILLVLLIILRIYTKIFCGRICWCIMPFKICLCKDLLNWTLSIAFFLIRYFIIFHSLLSRA